MEDDQENLIKLKVLLNSLLITVKDLLTVEQLRKDFSNMEGKDVPFRKFGFPTMLALLESMSDTFQIIWRGNVPFVKPFADPRVAHIAKMVKEQKNSKKRSAIMNPTRKPRSSYSWYPPPLIQGAPKYRHPFHMPYQVNRDRFGYPPNNWNNVPQMQTFRGRGAPGGRTTFVQRNDSSTWREQPNKRGSVKDRLSWPSRPASRPNNRPVSHEQIAPPPMQPVSLPPSLARGKAVSPTVDYSAAKQRLEAESAKLGVSVKFSTTTAGKKKPYWISNVMVNSIRYTTYPKEIRTREEAEEAVATAALKGLQGLSIGKKIIPDTKEFTLALRRVIKIVNNEGDGGIWYDGLIEKYQSDYNEKMGDTFLEQFKAHNIDAISLYSPETGRYIFRKIKPHTSNGVFQNEVISAGSNFQTIRMTEEEREPEAAGTPVNTVDEECCERDWWPDLDLPNDKHWDVYVTFIKSCNSVSLRLIGKQYHEAYENLITNMELHFVDKENRIVATNVVENECYAYVFEEAWFRVCVQKVTGDSASIYFVDYGDEDDVPLSSLHKLKGEFQLLPMQCVQCNLAGIDPVFQHDRLLDELNNLALSKSLVAEVMKLGEECPSVVLYDTSTEEDININERLLEILPQTFAVPKLPVAGGVCEAYLTHINGRGDLSVTLDYPTYHALQSLLKDANSNITASNSADTICPNKLYLSKYSPQEDGSWSRTTPKARDSANCKVLMNFVDIGATKSVSTADIVSIDAGGPILAKVPHQALRCRLSNVPTSSDLEWSQATVDRLNELIPKDSPLIMKVQKDAEADKPAEVELFKRLQPGNELISINATLAHDSSLFKKKESFAGKAQEESFPKAHIPSGETYFDVHVCYAASPHNFGVRNHKVNDIFNKLMEEMQCHYNKQENAITAPVVQTKQLCVAQDSNLIWYRVKVDHCAGVMVSGLKVDCGDIFCTTTDKMQPLLRKFRTLPPQGYRAALGKVTPVNKDWTPEDCLRFKELVEDKNFVSVVLSVAERETLPHLELKLIDTSGAQDIHIDQLFVNEGRAAWV